MLNCNLCLNIVHIHPCHWGSNNTGSSTGVVKWPIFWGIGCWWADEEEGGSASWVVPNFVRTPTLPCIGEVVWLSGSPWGCKGLFAAGGRVAYSRRWPLSPWRPSLSNLMYIFQRRERWGEADWHTTASSVCAFYNNTSSRCLCQTNEVQAVKGIDSRWNLLDKFSQTLTFGSRFVCAHVTSH